MATERHVRPAVLLFSSPSLPQRWALLLLVLIAAALLRFWQLGEIPYGLYRDEAWNGLDALQVLQGEYPLFFPANNGREPTYIYLVALAVAWLGPSALAVRLGAAIISTLTTLTTYQLGRSWFGWRTGILAAWLWATTVWPFHLGRIGFRAVLLPFYLSLIFWLGTEAYRKPIWWRWLLVGLVYGLSFYTYLAVRFTPVLLVVIGVYVWWRGRREVLRIAVPWFSLGTFLVLTPFLLLMLQQPEIISGRTGQVSIFNPAINQGDPFATLLQHIGQALGLFFWQGDTILRHNPPGRPLFDWLMVAPVALGIWVSWQWRERGAIVALWSWLFLMLWPTILAEDTPHFLRAVGILPAALLIPALGLSHLSSWNKLTPRLRLGLVLALCGASTLVSIRDYFWVYARQPETAYLFEAAARDMAEAVQAEQQGTTVFIDQRLWEGWPSLPFLLAETPYIQRFNPAEGVPIQDTSDYAVYVWPFAPHDFLEKLIPPIATLTIESGSLARGDLESTPLPFAMRYRVQPTAISSPGLAEFGTQITLLEADYQLLQAAQIQFELRWQVSEPLTRELKVFVHIKDGDTLIGQWDMAPGQGYWPWVQWQPGLQLQDRFVIDLQKPFDEANHTLWIGLYDAETLVRLPVSAGSSNNDSDSWRLPETNE